MNKVKSITQEQADELYRRLPKPDKFVFAIGMETGLRISDILRIKNQDITNPIEVYVSRSASICSYKLSEWLYNELINRWEYDNPDHYILCSTRKYKRSINRTTYHRHIKRALEGLDFDASAHSTRKFYLNRSQSEKSDCNSTIERN